MKASDGPRDLYLTEILGQPAALRRAGRAVLEQRDGLRRLAELGDGAEEIVLTGMGSSYDACQTVATTLADAGVLATTVNAAELLHFRQAVLGPRTLLVVVSQSGESAEVVRLGRQLRTRTERPRLVAVTNGLASPLAAIADLVLDTRAGPERGPSTMTFAGSLVVLTALTRVLSAGTDADLGAIASRMADDAEAAALAAERLLTDPEAGGRRLTAWLAEREMLTILGRGVARAAAEMSALTLKEAARFPAESLESAEFRHGPLELAGPRLAVVIFATEPATFVLEERLAAELAGQGAAVLFVSAGGPTPPGALGVEIGVLERQLAPAVAIVPLQLLAWQLALARGLRPGEFTRASKVTTRE